MNQSDWLFLVLIAITSTSLIVFVVQFFRGRRGGGSGDDGRAGWWEGPWDEDRKP
ncbi:hypothetical protein [Microbacterium hydrocarbonoxydans]|uniref:hypothetical protein n=1 Tax=Microbacterium hydrocarbonoxydans TaxID=273678 RepID=UPI0007BC0646|nr:hypothetical protein [Microbacterium hydrocarbonoxydans]GAT71660.1 glutamate receptor [Microbacterium sp. HM58-2]